MDIDDNTHRLEMKKWIRSQFEMAVNKQDTNDEVLNLSCIIRNFLSMEYCIVHHTGLGPSIFSVPYLIVQMCIDTRKREAFCIVLLICSLDNILIVKPVMHQSKMAPLKQLCRVNQPYNGYVLQLNS